MIFYLFFIELLQITKVFMIETMIIFLKCNYFI